ncbi:MAG: tetratricopeptide repeat protein [Candidatus Rifleibacteriota bacterium]
MSINNKKNQKLVLLCLFSFFFSVSAFAVNVQVFEGGFPFADPGQLIQEGVRLGNSQMLRKAWKHYEETLMLSGASPFASLEMGKIYYHLSLLGDSTEEDYDTAEFFARQAVQENPHSADAHRALALVLAGRGAYLDAFQELSLAITLNPTNQMLIYDLAALHITLHQPEKTIALLEGRNHDSGWPYVVLSMAWLQKNQRGKALLSLMKARKLGHSGYWIDELTRQISTDLDLPID